MGLFQGRSATAHKQGPGERPGPVNHQASLFYICNSRSFRAFFYAFRALFWGTVPAFPASVAHAMLASVPGTVADAAPVMPASVPATVVDAAPAFPGNVLANCPGPALPYPAGAPAAGSGVVPGLPGEFRVP